MKISFLLLLSLLAPFLAHQANADAVMVNKAMQATTIAEYFIDETGVNVELEISEESLPTFKALIPDTVYQKLGFGDTPESDRLSVFFKEQLSLIDSDKYTLQGRVIAIGPSTRVLRDPVNGTPLPIQTGAPEVIRATLHYDFNDAGPPPTELSFISPRGQDIGFIAYHNSVAINDFRYLSPGLVVELDWQDPWYSRFTSNRMQRMYSAPMSGFIYVEPFEVRKEIIVRPKDLQRWIDLGLQDKKEIPIELQGIIKEKAAKFLAAHQPVTIDGRKMTGIIDSVNFLERTLTSSRVVDPPKPLNIDSAILGIITVYPRNGTLPNEVVMEWDLWDERIQKISVSAVDQAGPLPSFLEPDWNQLRWENFLKNPEIPEILVIESPAGSLQIFLYNIKTVLFAISIILLFWLLISIKQQRTKKLPIALLVLCVCLSYVAHRYGMSNQPEQERASRIISHLLHNIYRSFDYREESDIYDLLEQSVSGELLTNIFLETKRSLVLANQGGARAKVKDIIVESVTLKPGDKENSFKAEAIWVVSGSVGHWGHVHKRNNRYQALLQVSVNEQQWKLEEMAVLQEERL
ncbi:MAG: hypothetical protein V7722_00755 [Porticoccus sp.]